MAGFSRRQLADYAVNQLLAGEPLKKIARQLAAASLAGGKQPDADLLINDISLQLEQRGILANAVITSAHPLSQSARRQLAEQIKKAAGVEKVVLEEKIDNQVIGGFRVETARQTWDKTVARQLRDIKGGI